MQGFDVPPREPSGPGTLLVRVLSQCAVRWESSCATGWLGLSSSVFHYPYLVVAWIWGAVRGCCITIILLLLNFHVQEGVFCPYQVVGVISQCAVARSLPTIIWMLLRLKGSDSFCLPLGPQGLPGRLGPQGSPGGRGPGSRCFLFTVTNTVTVTNVITIAGTMLFLL